jgi:hypothetical protein
MNWKLVLCAVVLAAPGVAAAQDAAPASSDDRVICKSFAEIGSRLKKKKSCRTAKEWADLRQQTRDKTEEIQRRGLKGS